MKKIALTLIIAGAAFATEASAQVIVRASSVPPGQRPPAGMCRVWVDGVPPGRQPRPTDCARARATAPLNSRIIVGNDTPFPGRAVGRFNDGDCEFDRRGTTIGDVIFGRSTTRDRDRDCRVSGSREAGVWYPVGRDRDGNILYERRTRARDGRIVVERARSRNGTDFERIGSRRGSRVDRDTDSDSDRRARGDRDSDRSRVSRAERDRVKEVRKAQKEREKAIERARRDAERNARRGRNGRGNGRDG